MYYRSSPQMIFEKNDRVQFVGIKFYGDEPPKTYLCSAHVIERNPEPSINQYLVEEFSTGAIHIVNGSELHLVTE